MPGFVLGALKLGLGEFSAVGCADDLMSKSTPKSMGAVRSTLVPPLMSKKSVLRKAEKSSLAAQMQALAGDFQILADELSAAVFRCDPTGVVLFHNARWAELVPDHDHDSVPPPGIPMSLSDHAYKTKYPHNAVLGRMMSLSSPLPGA